jgi:hypothetical protein
MKQRHNNSEPPKNSKDKTVPVLNKQHTMKTYGEQMYSSIHFNLYTRWMCQPHDPAALLPGEKSLVSIGNKAELASELVWTLWERDLFPCLESNPDYPVVQPLQ